MSNPKGKNPLPLKVSKTFVNQGHPPRQQQHSSTSSIARESGNAVPAALQSNQNQLTPPSYRVHYPARQPENAMNAVTAATTSAPRKPKQKRKWRFTPPPGTPPPREPTPPLPAKRPRKQINYKEQ